MLRSRRLVPVLCALAAVSALGACAYNEALGRSQLLLVDSASLTQQSNAAWQEALRTQKAATTGAQVDRIRRVGGRLVQAAGLADRSWDYAVFSDDSPNAFVLPSVKIGLSSCMV